jgi:hypothetical protein
VVGRKYFGTCIIVSETTAALTRSAFVWRELDAARVTGRSQLVRIFELLAEVGRETPEQAAHAARGVDPTAPGLFRLMPKTLILNHVAAGAFLCDFRALFFTASPRSASGKRMGMILGCGLRIRATSAASAS